MKNGSKSRRLALLAAALLVLAATSAGRLSGEGIVDLVLQAGNAVTRLPSTIYTHFRELSLAKLDPTCPQCN
jgi:hypothetical protein